MSKKVIKNDDVEEEVIHEENKSSIVSKIVNVVLWIILFAWLAMCLTDFYKTRNREKPIFTFKTQTYKYEDGEVKSYLGLGYKIYNYKRKCFDGTEFGPFWTKDRSLDNTNCSK